MPKQRRQTAARRERLVGVLDHALVYTVALLLLSIPLFMLTSVSEYGYGKSMFALVGISLLTILWGWSQCLRGAWTVRWPWITVPFLAFVAAALSSMLTAMNGRVVVQSLLLVMFFFLLLIVILNIIRDRKDVHLFLFALLVAGFLASVYGLLQYLGVLAGPYGGTGLRETISTMGNRNYLGGFLSYLLFPSVILVVSPRWRWVRVVASVMIAFCFGMALLVQQTEVVVVLVVAALALAVGLVIFRPTGALRKSRLWLLLLAALLVVTFLVEAPSGPLNSVVGLSADGDSWIGRVWHKYADRTRSWDWWVGWEMFKDAPVTGIGLGHYKLQFLEYKADFLATPRGAAYDFYIARAAQAHNDYVQVLAETGLVGGLAVVGFIVVLAVSIWLRVLRSRNSDHRLELLLLACGLIPALIHALVSFPAHLPSSSLLFITLIAVVHSRAYGETAVRSFSMNRRFASVVLAVVSALGLTVSGFALADLHANALMYEGFQQLQLGNVYAAEALLTRSLRYDFAPRQTYYHLASAQLQLERYDDAWENLQRCLTRYLDEGVYLTYANLAANRGELDTAQQAIDVLLNGQPQRAVEQQARYIEALIAIRAHDYDRAVQLLESLTQDHRSYETGFIALGDLYAAQGLTASARSNLDRALTLIDRKLDRANERLASGEVTTIAEYGELRREIELLTQQRGIVVDRLADLP